MVFLANYFAADAYILSYFTKKATTILDTKCTISTEMSGNGENSSPSNVRIIKKYGREHLFFVKQ